MINWGTMLPAMVASFSLLALVAIIMIRINDLEKRLKAIEQREEQSS
jgi:hypothetical protein